MDGGLHRFWSLHNCPANSVTGGKKARNNLDEEDTKMLEVTNECGVSDEDVKDFTCLH